MQQTDKVNGMQAVKFVELARGYTRNAHTYRIETVKEMDRWIRETEERRGETGSARGEHETGEGKQCGYCLHSVYRPGNYPQCCSLSLLLSLSLSFSLVRAKRLQHQSLTTAIRNSTADRHANSSRARWKEIVDDATIGAHNARHRTHLSRVLFEGRVFRNNEKREQNESAPRLRSSLILANLAPLPTWK